MYTEDGDLTYEESANVVALQLTHEETAAVEVRTSTDSITVRGVVAAATTEAEPSAAIIAGESIDQAATVSDPIKNPVDPSDLYTSWYRPTVSRFIRNCVHQVTIIISTTIWYIRHRMLKIL